IRGAVPRFAAVPARIAKRVIGGRGGRHIGGAADRVGGADAHGRVGYRAIIAAGAGGEGQDGGCGARRAHDGVSLHRATVDAGYGEIKSLWRVWWEADVS